MSHVTKWLLCFGTVLTMAAAGERAHVSGRQHCRRGRRPPRRRSLRNRWWSLHTARGDQGSERHRGGGRDRPSRTSECYHLIGDPTGNVTNVAPLLDPWPTTAVARSPTRSPPAFQPTRFELKRPKLLCLPSTKILLPEPPTHAGDGLPSRHPR
jgi:hypothetical protein